MGCCVYCGQLLLVCDLLSDTLSTCSPNVPGMVQVLVDNPDNLEAIRQRESDLTKERINLILATGANVVLTTQVQP